MSQLVDPYEALLDAYMLIDALPGKRWEYVLVAKLSCLFCEYEVFRVWSPFDLLSGSAISPPIERCPTCRLISVWFDEALGVRLSSESDAIIDEFIARLSTPPPPPVAPAG